MPTSRCASGRWLTERAGAQVGETARPYLAGVTAGDYPGRQTKGGLLRVIGVNGMRDKNAGAEKSHQNCCKLNHDTHPYARPALIQY